MRSTTKKTLASAATVIAVIGAGFLSGWSSQGMTTGITLAAALGAAAFAAVFHGGDRWNCHALLRRADKPHK
jgi:hypothetical protein